jgi:hypothetical protein
VADDAVDRKRGKINSRGEPKLSAQVKMWPTPTVQDSANNGGPAQMARNTKPLNAEVGGSLNPPWVEWLMGWPINWTSMEPLPPATWAVWLKASPIASTASDVSETDKSRRNSCSHG